MTARMDFSDEAWIAHLEEVIEQYEEMLQYVANQHLCGTWLLDKMKEHGIEYQETLKEETEEKSRL